MAEGMRAARASRDMDIRGFAIVASMFTGDMELEVSSGASFWEPGDEEMVNDDDEDDGDSPPRDRGGLGRRGFATVTTCK